jgi:hypothetical protein
VTLPEVVTGDLAGKFSEISLYNQHVDFELGSDSNSNLASPWAIACEPAIEPSCADSPLHEHFPYGLCNASKAHVKVSPHDGLGKRSPPRTTRTPTPSPASTRTPPTSSTLERTRTSPSPRSPRPSNRCQGRLPAWL